MLEMLECCKFVELNDGTILYGEWRKCLLSFLGYNHSDILKKQGVLEETCIGGGYCIKDKNDDIVFCGTSIAFGDSTLVEPENSDENRVYSRIYHLG